MEEEEFIEVEPAGEEPVPLVSGRTIIRQTIICSLIILGFLGVRRLPWIGAAIEDHFDKALNVGAEQSFGRIAKQPLIRDLVGWAKDGWRSMSVQTTTENAMRIKLTPPVPGGIKRDFGWQPAENGEKRTFHPGIDLMAPKDCPIRASQEGKVHKIYQDAQGLWVISLLHNGGFSTVYANCGSVSVKEGQQVKTGQELGVSAKSLTEGEVVHWEVWQGIQPLDPRSFVQQ